MLIMPRTAHIGLQPGYIGLQPGHMGCSLCCTWSQVPSSDALPEICAWMPLDAALAWKHKPEEGFVVWGFGRLLSPAAIQKQAEEGSEWWISRRVRRAFGFAEKPRAPPSSADPSALLRAELGESATRIETEDDVLHLKARHMHVHTTCTCTCTCTMCMHMCMCMHMAHVHASHSPRVHTAACASSASKGVLHMPGVHTVHCMVRRTRNTARSLRTGAALLRRRATAA
jgi:hypothetical protein